MQNRQDPRDQAKLEQLNQESSTDSTQGGNMLPPPSHRYKSNFGEEPTKPVTPPKTWEFTDSEKRVWGMLGEDTSNIDTPIGHAWARLRKRGIDVGPALSSEDEVTESKTINGETRDVSTYTQSFLHATATFVDDPQLNPNMVVEFTDARGLVGSERGI